LALSSSESDHFFHRLTQLRIDFGFVLAMDAAQHEFRAATDEAFILVAPLHKLCTSRRLRLDFLRVISLIPSLHPTRAAHPVYYARHLLFSRRKVLSAAMNERISIKPDVCSGQPVARGTRITVQTILEFLAAGDSVEDVLEEYPNLTRADIEACIQWADAAKG